MGWDLIFLDVVGVVLDVLAVVLDVLAAVLATEMRQRPSFLR